MHKIKQQVLSFLKKIIPFRIILKADRELFENFKRTQETEDVSAYLTEMSANAVLEFSEDPFRSHTLPKNTVLLVEPNPYHGETLPGYTDYFRRLGYAVDLMVPSQIMKENPFCRVPQEDMPNIIFCSSPFLLSLRLSLPVIKQYKAVFFSTPFYRDFTKNIIFNFDVFEKFSSHPYLSVAHDVGDALNQPYFRQKMADGRLLSLSGFQNVPQVIPHYFGSVKILPKNPILKIAVIGVRQDSHYLLESLSRLDAKISCIIYNVGAHDIPSPSSKASITVHNMGRLSYGEMFSCIEGCDFILSQLHMGNGYFARFSTDLVTGANQLALAFRKPWIISSPFAKAYGWMPQSAVIHDEGCLHKGIEQAAALSPEEYTLMQDEIARRSQELQAISLNNLSSILTKKL